MEWAGKRGKFESTRMYSSTNVETPPPKRKVKLLNNYALGRNIYFSKF